MNTHRNTSHTVLLFAAVIVGGLVVAACDGNDRPVRRANPAGHAGH